MNGQTLVPCPHCGTEYKKQGLSSHVFRCKENPDRIDGQLLIPIEKLLVENCTHARKVVRRRILKENVIPYICEICDIGPEWQGNPMPLILDHKNGSNNDNRKFNLRFICSNCDSQLDTYKAKNIGR